VLVAVDDPYHYASANELSLFRRPLPSTNLRFVSTLMWDGRESSPATGTLPITFADPTALVKDLAHQAQDATLGHARAELPGLSGDQQQQIVESK
jgi:cytochrome c peroxidase